LPRVVLRVESWSRNPSGAVTIRSVSWQSAALRALTALSRATRSCRIDSTIPVVSFGTAVASPASARRAAISASIGSLLPRRRRA
jgi:hypothetical protein